MKQALLIIDVQNQVKDVVSQEFLNKLEFLINECHNKGIPTIHILTEYSDDKKPLLNQQKQYDYFMEGSYETKEINQIRKLFRPEDYKIIKHHYDSFYNTELDKVLRELKIDSLIITGLYTHWCVLSTVFSALSRDYNISIVKECVTSKHSELSKLILEKIFDKKVDALRVVSYMDAVKSDHSF